MTEEAKPAKAPKATKELNPPKPKEKLPPMEVQNGVTRPRNKEGSATAAVWNISDAISKANGAPATRAEVLEAAEAQGINPATISTQFAKWRKFNGIEGRQPKAEKPEVQAAE